jgi:threonine dehydratase
VDGDFDMARERAAALARHDGIRLVEDSADIETCEGAATIGLELAGTAPAFDAILVQEASIIAGMRMLLEHAGPVVEPSAALGIAAILEDRDRFAGRHLVTIVCGSNVDLDAYHRWVGAAPIHRS